MNILSDPEQPYFIAVLLAVILLGLAILLGIACLVFIWIINQKTVKAIKGKNQERGLFIPQFLTPLITGPVEKLIKKHGPQAAVFTGIGELWIYGFTHKAKRGYLLKALKYVPAEALYPAVIAASEQEKLIEPLTGYLKSLNDPYIIKKIALSAGGSKLKGERVLPLFAESLEALQALTNEYDWKLRFFAYQLLIHVSSPASKKICSNGFSDSEYRIRKLLTESYSPQETEDLYPLLFSLLTEDPVNLVRESAKTRILTEFPARYSINPANLTHEQALRFLLHLKDGLAEDEKTAFHFLLSAHPELRLPAARHLDSTGFLRSVFLKINLTDSAETNRALSLLFAACEVHVSGFMDALKDTKNPGTLFAAVKVTLKHPGSADLTLLAEKVFSFFRGKPFGGPYEKIYSDTLTILNSEGDHRSLLLLASELKDRGKTGEEASRLFAALPSRNPELFIPVLLDFLKDPSFQRFSDLCKAFLKFPVNSFFSDILSLLNDTDNKIHRKTKIECVKLLAELKLPCCVLMILEKLHLMPLDEAKQIVHILSASQGDNFEQHGLYLLHSTDAQIRSALISGLPASGRKTFLPLLRKALTDPDPRVRSAAVWSLADFGEPKLVPLLSPLLRDQAEDVRVQAASVLAEKGTDQGLEELKKTLFDKNEVDPVKEAVINGLGASGDISSVDLLMEKLAEDKELQQSILKALARKGDKKELSRLLELIPSLPPQGKKLITGLFSPLSGLWEENLLTLLREDRSGLRETILFILESGGYLEKEISLLHHRDPEVRQNAARVLSVLATRDSYRGIILAARDPAGEVRMEALKVLESLKPDERESLLSDLRNDPDKRVRKYTRWVMEQAASKES